MKTVDLVLAYGLPAVFAGLVLEFFGLPVPGEEVLLFAGGLAATGRPGLLPLILFATAGSFAGYWLAYEIGKRVGIERLIRYGRYVRIKEAEWHKAQSLYDRYSVPLLLGSRYIIGVRHLTPYLAGLANLPTFKFLMYDLVGSVLWTIPLILIGRSVGAHWREAVGLLHRFGLLAAAGLMVLIMAYLVYRRLKAKR
ncbi:MAG: DedA family protein [Firmicutes bacterium]|nr:DedA family protein [Bacillota bacterium]